MNRRGLAALAAAALAPLVLAQEPAPPTPASATPLAATPDLSQGEAAFSATASAELEVKRSKAGQLLVHPLVNGKDAGWFIFDTGAGICCIDDRQIEPLGLAAAGAIDALGVGGPQATKLWRADKLELGPLTLTNHPLMSLDLAFLEKSLGAKIGGIVGYGVLSRCVAEVDVKAPAISLFDPADYEIGDADWTEISLADRRPTVAARFEGHDGRFVLDLGDNSTLTFHPSAIREWKLLDGRTVTPAPVGGVGGVVDAQLGTIATFELCGLSQRTVSARFVTETRGTSADGSRTGSIGLEYLAPYFLVIDYPSSRVAMRER